MTLYAREGSIYDINVLMCSVTFSSAAIALNEVDDVRPVLDYYKQKGESNILETFKSIKAKVQEEEEILSRYRETQKCKSSGVGKISIYHRSRSRPPSMPVRAL